MINDSLLSVTGGDLISYLNGAEGTATSVNQAWMDYLTREGYTTGTLNDRLYNKLRDDGFTGTLADMLTGFWSTPPVSYVARLDGATQFWQLSEPVSVPAGGAMEFDFYAESVWWQTVISGFSEGGVGRIGEMRQNGTDSTAELIGYVGDATSSLNGVDVVSRATVFPIEKLVRFRISVGSIPISYRHLCARDDGSSASSFMSGYVKNLRVYDGNDVLTQEIPLTNKDQGAYQVATTTSLGENVYTKEIIENPLFAMDQWSYLGDGRWQLIGDGSANTVQFLSGFDQPESGYIQFEIESITGSTITCTQNINSGSVFSTTGVKTFYYSSKSEIQSIQFKRGSGAVQAVIKNIKHFDAEGVLIAEMVGYNENVWEEV